ncbi:MAG: GtrA family protein [Minicystis sp.]
MGALFTALTVPLLDFLREVLGLPLTVASLVSWEIGTLLRFFINDRWVFGERRPTWARLWKYHAAAAGTFVLWWTATNVIPRWGVHYLAASVLATGLSVTWSLASNYLWVWSRREGSSSNASRQDAWIAAFAGVVFLALTRPGAVRILSCFPINLSNT